MSDIIDLRIKLSYIASEVKCLELAMPAIIEANTSETEKNYPFITESIYGIESMLRAWYLRIQSIYEDLDNTDFYSQHVEEKPE